MALKQNCNLHVRRSRTVAVTGSQLPGDLALHRYVKIRLRFEPVKKTADIFFLSIDGPGVQSICMNLK